LGLLTGAPCSFDLLAGGRRELAGDDVEFLGDFPVAENLDAFVASLDQAGLTHGEFVDGGAVVEEPLEVRGVHDGEFLLEDVGEAALWKAPVQRHLAALEAEGTGEAGARLLPLP